MIKSTLTEDFLKRVGNLFVEETRKKIAERRVLLTEYGNSGIGEDLISSFYLLFHSLKGTGRTIGFNDVSTLAGEALDYLETLRGGSGGAHTRQVMLMLKSFLFRLENLIPDPSGGVEEEPALPQGPAEYGRVLVVDDDNALLLAVKERLVMEGLEAVTANSGPLALDMVSEDPGFDALVIDIVMPDMDGIQLCRLIRENDLRREVPIIFLTAEDSLDSKISGFEVGADDYLAKPFSLDELVVRVKAMIRRSSYFRQLIIRDPLTNAFNRRYFSQRLSEEIARCRRSGGQFTIFVLDVDVLKKVNDTYGHPVGDRVLVKLVDFLQGNLRKSDLLCRLGGDEFVIIFHGTPVKMALPVMERLKSKFGGIELARGDASFCITFSVGAAEYPTHGKNEEELLSRADCEMYMNKRMFREGRPGA